jgi:hypothetical protein
VAGGVLGRPWEKKEKERGYIIVLTFPTLDIKWGSSINPVGGEKNVHKFHQTTGKMAFACRPEEIPGATF